LLYRSAIAEAGIKKTKLKLRRQKVRDQLSVRSREPSASRRYQADEKFEGELPMAKPSPKVEVEKSVSQKTDTLKDSRIPSESQASHIQRLLKAKRKAGDSRQNEKTEEDK